ncbi:MAG: S-layer homology domain-containing protein [Peptoniphilus harei]|nr:S-layer homology domain-containing protein [Peptoniphilus harei]
MRNKKILGLLLAGVMVTSIPFNVFADGENESLDISEVGIPVAVAGDETTPAEPTEETPAKPTEGNGAPVEAEKTDPANNEENPKDKGAPVVDEFVVEFDPNGGKFDGQFKKDDAGKIIKPEDPTKKGHDFLGWYVGEKEAEFPYEVKENVKFVAHWQAKELNVKFDSDGGTAIADKKVDYNNAVEKPADPSREGYDFLGWYDGGAKFDFNTPILGDKTLTAKWGKLVPVTKDLSISERYYDNGRFYGKVTADGVAVEGAIVKLYDYDGSYTGKSDKTDANGYFDIYLGDYYYGYYDGYYDGYYHYDSLKDKYYYYDSYGDKQYVNYTPYNYKYWNSRYYNGKYYDGRYYGGYLLATKDDFNTSTKYELYGKYWRNWDYRYDRYYYDKYDHRVYPTDISRSNYSTSGYLKGYKNRTVYVYDDGTYLGSDTIDSNGYFKVSWNSPRVSTSRSLQYYVNGTYVSESGYSMIPVVNDLAAGATFVRGNAGAYADVTVYDSNGTRLGGASAGSTGIFNISLNRALRAGETIKVEAKESGKTSRSTEVKIAGQEAKATASVNQPSYIAGYPDGTFKPGREVTRAEAVRMFVKLVNEGKELPKNPTTKFKDANNKWYSDEINFAVSKGFISGYSDGTFKPNQGITRAEFAQMIAVFVKDGYPGSSNFKDVKGHWASNAIDQLYGNKTIKGFPDGTFKPDQKLTRAEAVTVLNSVFGRNTKSTSFANVNTNSLRKFSDVPMSHWAYYEIIDASNGHNAVKGDKAEDVSVWQ